MDTLRTDFIKNNDNINVLNSFDKHKKLFEDTDNAYLELGCTFLTILRNQKLYTRKQWIHKKRTNPLVNTSLIDATERLAIMTVLDANKI